jgi:hypothetical protein
MLTRTRVVSALLATLLLAGPLAPLAGAQQPTQPPPDLFQETLKAQRDEERSRGTYNAAAGVVNVFLVPGRAITCAVGGVVGVAVLALTFGTAYRAASDAWHEGCGGRWTVTGEDLRPDARTRMGGAMESY